MFGRVSPPKHPDNCEVVMYSSYHTAETVKSKFVKDSTVKLNSRGTLDCPRCGEKLPGLDHAEDTTCPECNLCMQVYGNALHLWEAEAVIDAMEEM